MRVCACACTARTSRRLGSRIRRRQARLHARAKLRCDGRCSKTRRPPQRVATRREKSGAKQKVRQRLFDCFWSSRHTCT
eukprot:6190906-Pleurochrysis_carterae.AAC.1